MLLFLNSVITRCFFLPVSANNKHSVWNLPDRFFHPENKNKKKYDYFYNTSVPNIMALSSSRYMY